MEEAVRERKNVKREQCVRERMEKDNSEREREEKRKQCVRERKREQLESEER